MTEEKKPEQPKPQPAPLDSTEVKDADLEKVSGGTLETLFRCKTAECSRM